MKIATLIQHIEMWAETEWMENPAQVGSINPPISIKLDC